MQGQLDSLHPRGRLFLSSSFLTRLAKLFDTALNESLRGDVLALFLICVKRQRIFTVKCYVSCEFLVDVL